jgi:hypothetical protein
VHFHFTPTHTSWLNQIECCFSILSRQALKEASFVDVKQLREAIDHYICAYNAQAVVEPDFFAFPLHQDIEKSVIRLPNRIGSLCLPAVHQVESVAVGRSFFLHVPE